MLTPRPYQTESIDRTREAIRRGVRRVLLTLATGGGKCLGIGTPVLMFDGTIRSVESIAPGDLLMGPDSQPRTVLSTTRGTGELYRIDPVKGEPWVCNDVHVLTLVKSTTGEITDISLPDYIASNKNFKHLHKQFAPERGVDFIVDSSLPIDPYFLGVWYGDGTKRLAGVAISKPDPEMLDLANETAAAWGLLVRTDGFPCPTHHLSGARGAGNPLLTALREVYGNGATLPHAYLTASRRDRESFLAGLLDSDGYLHRSGYEIVQKVKGFSEGICFLARSLGARALMSEKIVNGDSYWRVSLSGDFSALPMRIPRKRAGERKQIKCATRTGFDITPIGVGEYAGFELDGDGRFLLGDFTVTHNTIIAALIILGALHNGKRVLFLAHRHELIMQAFAKLQDAGINPNDIGVILAGVGSDRGQGTLLGPTENDKYAIWARHAALRPTAPIHVASIQTARRRTLPQYDVIFIDEAHLALAKSYTDLVGSQPGAVVIGLTATPEGTDGRGLGELFDELITIATPADLMRMVDAVTGLPFLCTPEIWTVPRLPDLSGVRSSGSDYDDDELAELLDKQELIGDMVEHYERRARGLRFVAFAVNVRHSQHIAERFRSAGYRCEHLDGNTPDDERERILSGLHSGAIDGVSSCNVLSEGWDDPAVWCGIGARPTKSWRLHTQQIGRILRPQTGKTAIWLDHAGNCQRHGPPWLSREFTLSARKRRRGADIPSGKICTVCYAVVASTERVCRGCGTPFTVATERRERMPKETSGDLVRMSADDRRGMWDTIISEWKRQNDKRAAPLAVGWCAEKYKEMFQEYPPATFPKPTLSAVESEKRELWNASLREAKASGGSTRVAAARYKDEIEARGLNTRPSGEAAPEPEKEEWHV